jgi:crossover junction endodeoxyribonuclease RuvC
VLALGIDPRTRHLGWGLVRRDGARCVTSRMGPCTSTRPAPLASRLLDLDRSLSGLLIEHHPDVAARRDDLLPQGRAAAAKLGHARGVVLLAPRAGKGSRPSSTRRRA